MAATVTIDAGPDGRYVQGSKYVRKGTINLGIYAANGIAVTKAMFDLPVSLDELDVRPSGGYVFEWDKTNAKIKAYRNKDPGAAGGADIPLPEVGSVDISAVVARFRAEGN